MKIQRTKDSVILTHGKRRAEWGGSAIHSATDKYFYDWAEKHWGYKPFRLTLPKIGTKIEKYWDVDYNAWTEGVSIWGVNFLKHHTFNEPNRYRISLKKPNPYDIKKYASL